ALVGGLTSYLLFAFYAYGKNYYGAMIATTVAVGTLVGLEVPLLTRLARRYASLRVAISSVLTWDYVGALVGALLFPLVLLPNLRLLAAAPATGLLNVAVAALILAIFWRDLGRRRIFAVATLAAVGVLAAALGLSRAASGAIDRRLYLDEVMLVRQSPYQK